MYGIFILPYTVSLRFVWEEGKDIERLIRERAQKYWGQWRRKGNHKRGGGGNQIVFGKCAILQTREWLLRIKKHIRKRALSTALCFTLLYWTITVVDSDLLRLT